MRARIIAQQIMKLIYFCCHLLHSTAIDLHSLAQITIDLPYIATLVTRDFTARAHPLAVACPPFCRATHQLRHTNNMVDRVTLTWFSLWPDPRTRCLVNGSNPFDSFRSVFGVVRYVLRHIAHLVPFEVIVTRYTEIDIYLIKEDKQFYCCLN